MEYELQMNLRSAEAIMLATIDSIEGERNVRPEHLYPIVHQVHKLLEPHSTDNRFTAAYSEVDSLAFDLRPIPVNEIGGTEASDVADRFEQALKKLEGKIPELE